MSDGEGVGSAGDIDRAEPFDMDLADSEQIESIANAVVGKRYRDTEREKEFTVTKAGTVRQTVDGHLMEATCLFLDWRSGSSGHQNVDDFQTLVTAGVYEEADASTTDTDRSNRGDGE